MRKRYIKLIIGVLIAVLLAFCYFFIFDEDTATNEADIGEASEDYVKIIDIKKEDIISLYLKSGMQNDNNFVNTEIISKENEDGKWVVRGYEKIALNDNNVDSFVESMASISGKEVLNMEKDLAEYGFYDTQERHQTSLTIKTTEGETVIYVGSATPDNAYYYARKADSDKIYLIDSLSGKRFGYTINDFADKSLPEVSPYKILKLNIKQRGKEEIDLEYTQNKEGNAENLIAMGMETMRMNKPYPGLAVYPTNLQESVLSQLTSMQLGDIADGSSENFFEYSNGVDTDGVPEAEITVSDDTNSLKMSIGFKADDKNYYCMVEGKEGVFLIDEKYINPFLEADAIKFIEKFVALHYRADLNRIEMTNKAKSYDITFGEELKNENSEDRNSRFNDDRKTYLNGKEVDKDTFGGLFELITGITFDSIDKEAKAVEETPEMVIKYTMKDGSFEEVRFLPFNDSFYVVDGKSIKGMLVSRQSVARVFDKADEILNG